MLTHSDHFFKMSIQHSINVTEHKKKAHMGTFKAAVHRLDSASSNTCAPRDALFIRMCI